MNPLQLLFSTFAWDFNIYFGFSEQWASENKDNKYQN